MTVFSAYRRPLVASVAGAAASVVLLACSSVAPGDGPSASNSSRVAYGVLDSTHTAVVSLLAPVGTTELEECSGSIVRVSGGEGDVLTAAHCCNVYVPTLVVVAADYAIGEPYLTSGTPAPPVYPVVPGSVWYDAAYSQDNQLDHDFCMLRFSGAPANTATLALPSTTDGLVLGAEIEHVGFGLTDASSTNSQRRSGTDTVDQQLTPLIIEFSQGGPTNIPGTCEGDSGGPSLLTATASQAQQVVVAVQSYGSGASCAQITFGVGSRVASSMGAGGFITSYLAGAPIGIHAGASTGPEDAGSGGAPVAVDALGGHARAPFFRAALAFLLLGTGALSLKGRRASQAALLARRRRGPRGAL